MYIYITINRLIRLSIISIIITMGYTYYSFWEHISGTLKTNWEMCCDFCLWKIVLGKMIGELVELMHFIEGTLMEEWKNKKEMCGKNMKKYHKTVARFGTWKILEQISPDLEHGKFGTFWNMQNSWEIWNKKCEMTVWNPLDGLESVQVGHFFLPKPGTSMDFLRSTLGVCHENRIYIYMCIYIYVYIYMYIYMYIYTYIKSDGFDHAVSWFITPWTLSWKNPKLAEETGLEASTLTLEIC